MKPRTKIFLMAFFLTFAVSGSISANGNWRRHTGNPVVPIGGPGEFDAVKTAQPASFLKDGVRHLFYTAQDAEGNKCIAVSISADGKVWQKRGVVLTPASEDRFDSGLVQDAFVLDDGDGLEMYYAGSDGIMLRIGKATSTDGMYWNRVTGGLTKGALLESSAGGDFDNLGVSGPCVIKRSDAYIMFFTGHNVEGQSEIGIAMSPDGDHWIKTRGDTASGAAFSIGSHGFDDNAVFSPSVIFDQADGIYRMWYTALHYCVTRPINGIGFASSPDGIHWRRHGSYLWRTLNLDFDSLDVYDPAVIFTNGNLEMYYTGSDDASMQIGLASAVPFELKADVQSHDFGDIILGRTAQISVEVANAGVLPLTVTAISSTNDRFRVIGAPSLPDELQPGDYLPLVLSFSPIESSSSRGEILFHATQLLPDYRIELFGAGNTIALQMPDRALVTGDRHELNFTILNSRPAVSSSDFYLALQVGEEFFFFPDWTTEAVSHKIILPPNFYLEPVELFGFEITPQIPDGEFVWWAVNAPQDGGDPAMSAVEMTTAAAYRQVEPWKAVEWFEEGRDIVFLDVRTPGEYCQEHITDAINIPLDQLVLNLNALNPDHEIIVYSNYSRRSVAAADILIQSGFRDLWNLQIGFVLWWGPKESCQR